MHLRAGEAAFRLELLRSVLVRLLTGGAAVPQGGEVGGGRRHVLLDGLASCGNVLCNAPCDALCNVFCNGLCNALLCDALGNALRDSLCNALGDALCNAAGNGLCNAPAAPPPPPSPQRRRRRARLGHITVVA